MHPSQKDKFSPNFSLELFVASVSPSISATTILQLQLNSNKKDISGTKQHPYTVIGSESKFNKINPKLP